MTFVLTFALALAHAFATFAAFPSTFPILAFAFAADAFALASGTITGVFVLAIFSAVCVRYVHVYTVLVSAWVG